MYQMKVWDQWVWKVSFVEIKVVCGPKLDRQKFLVIKNKVIIISMLFLFVWSKRVFFRNVSSLINYFNLNNGLQKEVIQFKEFTF